MIDRDRVEAILFDLDGVLVDTARLHYLSWLPITEGLGIDFDWQKNNLLKGKNRDDSLDILLKLGGIDLEQEQRSQLLAQKNDFFLRSISHGVALEFLPGMETVVNHARRRKYAIAVASGSRNARLVVDGLGLTDRLGAIVDGNEVKNGKPHPETFLKAAQQLQKEPTNCLVIEDSHSGVQAALEAQMQVIGIGSQEDLQASYIIFESTSIFSTWFLEEL